MTSASENATGVLELLIRQLGAGSGPIECVIAEWQGAAAEEAIATIDRGAVRQRALEVIEELGESWGPTGDPSWVENLVPAGRTITGHLRWISCLLCIGGPPYTPT